MTSISTDVYAVNNGQTPELPPSDNLGQKDFLRLMTEQLKHQDPLKPMESKEFMGQLAQFSTVQGINGLQDTVKGLSDLMLGGQILQGANLVGHDVLVPSENIVLGENGSVVKGAVAATAPGMVNFDIKDETGQIVKTISVKAENAGEVAFEWDGTDADGKLLADGKYAISATQISASDGEKTTLATYVNAVVESVTVGSDGLYLNLKGLGTAPINHVLRVS